MNEMFSLLAAHRGVGGTLMVNLFTSICFRCDLVSIYTFPLAKMGFSPVLLHFLEQHSPLVTGYISLFDVIHLFAVRLPS